MQQYHRGCTEILNELRQNAELRLKHDTTKLVESTKQLQARIKNTAEVISAPPGNDSHTNLPVPSVIAEDVVGRGQRLLEMLDGVSC